MAGHPTFISGCLCSVVRSGSEVSMLQGTFLPHLVGRIMPSIRLIFGVGFLCTCTSPTLGVLVFTSRIGDSLGFISKASCIESTDFVEEEDAVSLVHHAAWVHY